MKDAGPARSAPFTQLLPNFALVDTAGQPTTLVDFTIPTDGLESPWGMAKFVLFYDSARVPEPPALARRAARLGRGASRAASPTRHRPTSSARPSSSRCSMPAVPDPERLQQPVDRGEFDATDRRRLGAARPRATASVARRRQPTPPPGQALHQLLDDGEVDFSMAFNPAEASSLILAGRLPDDGAQLRARRRHHRQHPFRRDPVQRRAQGGRHGRRPTSCSRPRRRRESRTSRSGATRPCSTSPHSTPADRDALRGPDAGPGHPAARSAGPGAGRSRTRPGWC